MANLFLRLSSSFAYHSAKRVGKRKKETVFAHTVKNVHLKKNENIYIIEIQKKKKIEKDEPEKTKKELRLSSSFRVRVRLSLLSARISTKNEFFFFLNGPNRQCE